MNNKAGMIAYRTKLVSEDHMIYPLLYKVD